MNLKQLLHKVNVIKVVGEMRVEIYDIDLKTVCGII